MCRKGSVDRIKQKLVLIHAGKSWKTHHVRSRKVLEKHGDVVYEPSVTKLYCTSCDTDVQCICMLHHLRLRARCRRSRLTVWLKGKASSLDIAPLTVLDSGALQPRKWQLTGNDCSTAAQAVAAQSPP